MDRRSPVVLFHASVGQTAFFSACFSVSLALAKGDGAASSAEGGKQMVAHCSVGASLLARLG